jgi:hypothetical protein
MSAGNGYTEIALPRKCPKIGIERLEGPCSPVTLSGDPFALNAFRPGSEYVACDYDQPDGKITQIIRGRTKGPILYHGLPCIDMIQDQCNAEGKAEVRFRRIVHTGTHSTHTLLSTMDRADGGTGLLECVDLEQPLEIDPRCRWRVWEKETPDSEPILYHQQVDGLFNLHIGKRSMQCLRWLRLRTGQNHTFEEVEESFIATRTGLAVLIQHYIGKGWPQLDELKRSPKIEIQGQIFFLWFIRRVFRHDIPA